MKTMLTLLILSFVSFRLAAQSQAETYIKEAQTYLAQKDYKQAQLSLQDAINDINNLVAGQIAAAMPNEINGLKASDDGGVNTAGLGMMGGGFQISKNYQHPSKKENTAEVQILGNSPMVASINMFMGNPAMMGEGYKSVRVGTYRGILKTEMEDYYDDNGNSKKIRSSEFQLPMGQNLITIKANGFATEQEEIAFATKLDIDKLKSLLGE